jgi:EamA domain-containing membrane protein RarD
MFAILAAITFGILLFLDLINQLPTSDLFNWNTLIALGLFFVALHLCGFGTAYPGRWRGRRR